MPKASPKPTINLNTIGSIVTAKSPGKKGGNPEKLMKNIGDFTAVGRVKAEIEDAEAVLYDEAKAEATKILLDEGCRTGTRPSNFKGIEIEVDNGADLTHSVSCELRAYSWPLDEAAQKIAAEKKIPVTEVVLTHETYIINPELAANMAFMQVFVDVLNAGGAQITAAMAKLGLGAVEILMKQPGTSKVVTNDETLPAIFKLSREDAETVLPVFTTLAVGKGKHDSLPGEDNLERSFTRVEKVLNRPGFKAKMQGAAEKKKAEKSRKRAA